MTQAALYEDCHLVRHQPGSTLSEADRGPEQVLRAAYERIVAAGKAPVIVDAGSRYGASALLFAEAFPRALIFALEPDRARFAALDRNTSDRDTIVTIHAALGDRLGHAGDIEIATVRDILWLCADDDLEVAPLIVKVEAEDLDAGLLRSLQHRMGERVFDLHIRNNALVYASADAAEASEAPERPRLHIVR